MHILGLCSGRNVSNASPLILLDKIGHLWILGRLFQRVIISLAVNAEWLRPGGYKTPEWLSVKTLSPERCDNIETDMRVYPARALRRTTFVSGISYVFCLMYFSMCSM